MSLNPESFEKLVTATTVPETLSDLPREVVAVVIKALKTNAGDVYIGGASLKIANGYPLDAGETLSLAIELKDLTRIDLSKIHIDADNNGEGVRVFILKE